MIIIYTKLLIVVISIIVLSACGSTRNDTGSRNEISETTTTPSPKPVAHASLQLANMEKNQLVNESDTIISGTVLSQKVETDFTGFPVTDTLIQVKNVYKGEPVNTLEVRAAGGETDDMIYIIEPSTNFTLTVGEEVVLFLSQNGGSRPDEESFYYVVGQPQGKFSVDAQSKGVITNSLNTHKFNFDSLQKEIEELEKYNKKHKVPRLVVPEGQESGS